MHPLLLLVLASSCAHGQLSKKTTTPAPSNFYEVQVNLLLGNMTTNGANFLPNYSAVLSGIGSIQVDGFGCGKIKIDRVGGLRIQVVSKETILSFAANFNEQFQPSYKELKISIGDIKEKYRVVGKVRQRDFNVSIRLPSCKTEVDRIEITGETLQAEGEGKWHAIAMVLAEWESKFFWRKLEEDTRKKLTELFNSKVAKSELCKQTHF